VPAAAALARKFDSQVYVAHVFLPPLYPNVPASAAAVLLAEERQNAEWQMKNFLRDEAFRELAPQALFATGAPVESLLDLIDKNHIDLVVIATHGRSGLRRMVLGSVAEALMRHSPCPILMVPRTAQQG
jgi:nucleotide-binding universal stress UspA family protein